MNTWNTSLLDETFLEVVEQLAFMFGDPADPGDVVPQEGPWVRARLGFEGRLTGSLSLAVPEELCGEIAANILGLDPEDLGRPDIAHDSLKELLNVVAGNVVPALQGEGGDFGLSVPVLDVMSAAAVAGAAEHEGVSCYDLEGSPVLVELVVESSPAA